MDLDVYQKLVRFQTELVANKNLVNKFGNWNYRSRNGDEAPAITQTPKAETPKAENKPKTILKNNTEDYSNVVDWINNTEGASIVPLKKRFIMTAEMESQLIKLINLNIQK
mgnify:CR=1 FL=1